MPRTSQTPPSDSPGSSPEPLTLRSLSKTDITLCQAHCLDRMRAYLHTHTEHVVAKEVWNQAFSEGLKFAFEYVNTHYKSLEKNA